jgi:hypothetical protein
MFAVVQCMYPKCNVQYYVKYIYYYSMLVFTQQRINIESSISSPHTYSPQMSSEFAYLWSGDFFSIFLYLYFLFSQTLYFAVFRREYTHHSAFSRKKLKLNQIKKPLLEGGQSSSRVLCHKVSKL